MRKLITLIEIMSSLPLLICAQDLADVLHQPEVLIVDLGRLSVYQQVHVPNACWLDGRRLLSGDPDAVGSLPSLAQLQHILSQIGFHPDRHVVVYDDEGGGWASRLIWTLHMIGHHKVSLLDGGIHAWLADGMPTDSGEAGSCADWGPLALSLHRQAQASRDVVVANLDTQHFVLWDCRSREEYTGERLLNRRGGHIPNAHHYEWTCVMQRDNKLRLKPLDVLRQELMDHQILQDKPIITYCQSHHRSSLTYVVGKLLGLDICAYDGGFSEWGNRSDTLIHVGETP